MGPETETTPEGTWDQAVRQEVTSYRNPHPVNRMTHASENVVLPQTSFAGGIILFPLIYQNVSEHDNGNFF